MEDKKIASNDEYIKNEESENVLKEDLTNEVSNNEEASKEISVNNDDSAMVTSETDVDIIEEEEVLPPEPLKEVTPKQKKIQLALGLLSGMLVWLSLGIGYYVVEIQQGSSIYSWLFVVVFLVIMLARRYFESKQRYNTRPFMKYFLIGLIIFLGVYVLISYLNGWLMRP